MNWLAEHGDDTVPVKIIDLMSVIVRLEQAHRMGRIEIDGCASERLITCDVPRLRRYLPDEALSELES